VTTTITAQGGAVTITPDLVLGYATSQASSTQIHLALGATYPSATTRPAIARSGTLNLLFKNENNANNCRIAHTEPGTLTLTTTDLNHADMVYVPVGQVTMSLDDTTHNAWIVTVGFQEVST
jgi:hypothetical protein